MDLTALVFDCGSTICKAGYAGNEGPTYVFPTVIGRPRQNVTANGISAYVGDEAISKVGTLKLNYPIEHGVVTNW
jgi:actin